MRATCVVQARMGSTRLPGKVLADLGGRPLLRFMLDRLATAPVDALVVATTIQPADDPVARVADEAGAHVVRGSEDDVLGRFGCALDAHPADLVVRLTADCPLADPRIVADALALQEATGAEYASNTLVRTFPDGLDVEVVTAAALRAAMEEATDPPEREHVTPFVYRRPERFHLASLRTDELAGDERWTVDTAADLDAVRQIVEILSPRTDFGWRDALAARGRRADRSGLRLRPAMASDSPLLLDLRNDPDAVRHSRTGRPVTEDEHRRWLASRLESPSTRLWIAENDERPVGQVRTDVTNAVGLVSIAVERDQRGQRYATRMLALLQDALRADFQVTALDAEIHAENPASRRAFEHAGFAPISEDPPFVRLRWNR